MNNILLDVRSPLEYKEGHIKGSINLPFYDIKRKIKNIIPDKTSYIVVYCSTGRRSKKVLRILKELGYKNVQNIDGGIKNIDKIFKNN